MDETNETGLIEGEARGEGGRAPCRCAWAGHDPLYQLYHDTEWGRPVGGDQRLFEKLCLEGFQAGLSWITILRKRDAFREVFHDFALERVAVMAGPDVERLLQDERIVRHRGKIEAAIANAQAALRLIAAEGSLAAFLWAFEPPDAERPEHVTLRWLQENPTTPASVRLSKALRKRGFRFVGPTTAYAFMQSMGFVNDHLPGCHVRAACERERTAFVRPRAKPASQPA